MADEEFAAALRAATSGDETGIAVLWRALQPAVLRYLRVVVGGDAAEDVASETWLQAVRGLHTFIGDAGAFRVWLFRIARHRGIDERRRQGRRREEALDLMGELEARSAARDVALDAIESSETDWALRLISQLPPDQGEAVMLRVVAGLDVAQTAQVLNKRPGAVRVAAMRGLRKLAADPRVQERRATTAAYPRTDGATAEGV